MSKSPGTDGLKFGDIMSEKKVLILASLRKGIKMGCFYFCEDFWSHIPTWGHIWPWGPHLDIPVNMNIAVTEK